MARKKRYRELFVYMNGVSVGKLLRESTGQLVFKYDQHWLDDSLARPVSLSMPLTEVPYKGPIVECYFENLLPDSDAIRKRIQARFNAESTKCFDLLSQIGGDCVGALQLLTEPLNDDIKTVKAEKIDDTHIAKLLKSYQTAPLGMQVNSDFRISIAGAQEKTALLWYQNHWCLPHETTPTSHIIKLPIGRLAHAGIDLSDSIENEWLCLQILAAYQLPVNQVVMAKFDDVKALVVERFDRMWSPAKRWLMRLPQEDFCQVLGVPPGLKYESDGGPGIKAIMSLLQNSENALEAREQFFKTVFLFWVMGAIDGHAKNFSVLLKPQGRFQLSPIYDVMSAYPIAEKRELEWQKIKMAMAVRSANTHYDWQSIQLRHWYSMAKQCHFPEHKMREIITAVFEHMDGVIDQVKTILPTNFPSQICDAVFTGMKKVRNRCGSDHPM
ncbi:type II toxin-antitoxin system HipA family toxin [Legionella sp. W05-934-2]|uniref:type II toxin-antitoxin system HipA family toxin n=1 Tax=Legionella sp. W05-934-2 TaxID=1198649 RepID=UPI0034626362